MKILGFDHVGICAKDPKAMADWYIEHLGFTLHSVGNGGNYFVESPDHVLIEIMVPMQGHDHRRRGAGHRLEAHRAGPGGL